MKIRDRYIAKTLLSYTLVVLVVWLSIYSFFNFLTEINVVGQESYTILSAIKYTNSGNLLWHADYGSPAWR